MLGQGKLQELVLHSLQLGADILVFDCELNPTQSRNIADQTDLKILDRSQLILDIFAQRAHSRDGKLQVELAQLKYLLPRLNRMNKAMSRLTGGIGGRGPGETKLEINRRRAHERISRLERQLKQVQKQRTTRRKQRLRKEAPILSAVGYTNAGKSTLVNTMTKSEVLSEDRLFSTLDPVSRRMRFPNEREVILTDTVGFIRDLPPDLDNAFRATLEELEDADVLLHVVDISDTSFPEQIAAVERILGELSLTEIPKVLVFNKIDRVPPEEWENVCRRYDAIGICAQDDATLGPLLEEIERHLAVIQPEVARPMWEIERDAYAAMGQAYEAQTEDQPEQETLDPPSSTDEA
jgi:GTP-binding protein HflX